MTGRAIRSSSTPATGTARSRPNSSPRSTSPISVSASASSIASNRIQGIRSISADPAKSRTGTGKSAGVSAVSAGTAEARFSACLAASSPASIRPYSPGGCSALTFASANAAAGSGCTAAPGATRCPPGIQHLDRRQRALDGAAGAMPERGDTVHDLDEQARQGQVRPGRIGGGVHQDQPALAALHARDQGRAVGQARPARGVQAGSRLGQHLAMHDDIAFGHLQPGQGARLVEAGERQRPGPRQRAAELAVAPAQRHRHQIVEIGIGKARPGEPQQHAAGIDPLGKLGARLRGRARPRPAERSAEISPAKRSSTLPRRRSAIGRQRPLDIVQLGQQRLAAPGPPICRPGRPPGGASARRAGPRRRPPSAARARAGRSGCAAPAAARSAPSASRPPSSNAAEAARQNLAARSQRAHHQVAVSPRRGPAQVRDQRILGRPPAAAAKRRALGADRQTRVAPEPMQAVAETHGGRARLGRPGNPVAQPDDLSIRERLALEPGQGGLAVDRPGLGQPARDTARARRQHSGRAAPIRPDRLPCRAGSPRAPGAGRGR